MRMVTSTLVIGRTTNQMERELTFILMGRTMRVIGLMISTMALERNSGLMEQCTKASTVMVRSMVRVAFNGRTEAVLPVNSRIIVWKVLGHICGTTNARLQANGKTI